MGRSAPRDRLNADAIPAFLARVGEHFRLEKAVLFGSRARGDHFTDPDVDLLLVSPDFQPLGFTERMTRVLEWWDGGVALEALCYTPGESARKRGELGIVGAAAREGVALSLPPAGTEAAG